MTIKEAMQKAVREGSKVKMSTPQKPTGVDGAILPGPIVDTYWQDKAKAQQAQRDTAQPVFERVADTVSAEDYNAIVETLQATIESLGNQLMTTHALAERLAEALRSLSSFSFTAAEYQESLHRWHKP